MLFLSTIFKKIFGSRNERVIRRLSKVACKINAFESEYEQLSDEGLRAKTDEFRRRLADGTKLDDLLIEAFAAVREASKRTLKMRHFDVQLVGGMVLHQGKIAEMCTGEGKTLVATLSAYLNALSGKGVHIITVNDYLARRDAGWMKPIYEFLGLTVGVNLTNMDPEEKRKAYAADITYGTNNEFGFDYLRDNMAFSLEEKVQRELNYAVVDEVDSILIDEARTPLIISGTSDDSSELYKKVNALIPKLTERKQENGPGDYYLDEKQKTAYLTEDGHQHIEELMYKAGLIKQDENLYSPQNIGLMHHVSAALRANKLYKLDVDYIVKDNEVMIIDEHTGRSMPGRRWSEGLHQAVEAKEGVKIQNENQTLATITFQNYFRLYNKLAGMTGTADTEAYEFQQIYGLEVIVIPTNKPLARKNHPDKIYLTAHEKFSAIIEEIKDCVMRGQPTLVGTASIDTSEYLSSMLHKAKIFHQVLNAKFHEKEAKIIAQAGYPGSVTIATNMAGRGTDIILGGNVEVKISELDNPTEEQIEKLRAEWNEKHDAVIEAGGLHVIGSERHESRRIDNQLRGRSGRQGDPGSSRFYVSLDDNLMRIFAADRVASIMKRLGMKEGESIEHKWITKAIENAQRKVETFHFDMRKNLLEFDNVANDQRKVIYSQRAELMELDDISATINKIQQDVINQVIGRYIPPQSMEDEWNIAGLEQHLKADFNVNLSLQEMLKKDSSLHEKSLRELILQKFEDVFQEKEQLASSEVMRQFEKQVMLQNLDMHWKEHLATMDHLRHSIHLSGYAQKNPKQEYKRESFRLFAEMLDNIKFDVIKIISTVKVEEPDDMVVAEEQHRRQMQANSQRMQFQHVDTLAPPDQAQNDAEQSSGSQAATFRREGKKVGRNDQCPCGSGKKYKHCCGKLV